MSVPIKKVDYEFTACNVTFSLLRQGELMSTLRALGRSALNRRWTAGTSESSTVCYVKGKAAFWAANNVFRLRTHFKSLSLNQTSNKVLKTFLRLLQTVHAEISITVKIINSVYRLLKCWFGSRYDVSLGGRCKGRVK